MQTNALRKAALASCLWTSAIPLTGAAEPDSNPMTIIKGDTVKAITGPPDKFTGNVVITPKFGMQGTQRSFATAGDVMFLPHSRSHWHSHPAGQYLIITAGQGWVQQWGKTRQTVSAGDVVWTPPDVKHWHGATNELPLTHTAVQGLIDGETAKWFEPVSDEQYYQQEF